MKKNIGSTRAIIADCHRGEKMITTSIERMMHAPADFLPHSLVDFNKGLTRYITSTDNKGLIVLCYYFGETLIRNLDAVTWIDESVITEASDLNLQLLLPFTDTLVPVDINPARYIKAAIAKRPDYLYSEFCLYETMLEAVSQAQTEFKDVESLVIQNEHGTYRYNFQKLEF